MLERVQPNFYPSLCTIQVATETDSSTGEPISSWADVPELVDIPCRIAAQQTREQRNSDQVYSLATHHVALNGYYPEIESEDRAVVDGVIYTIEGPAQHDGNQQMTRIFVRKIDD